MGLSTVCDNCMMHCGRHPIEWHYYNYAASSIHFNLSFVWMWPGKSSGQQS